MTTITIPKRVTRGAELVVIPREEYEEFLHWQRAVKPLRVFKTFRPTAAELKDLKRARQDYKKGKYMAIDEFKRRLDIKS